VAHYHGVIQVNWNHVQQSVESTRQTLGRHFTDSMSTFVYNVMHRCQLILASFPRWECLKNEEMTEIIPVREIFANSTRVG